MAPYSNLTDRWVAGALDSAWRAVDQYLALHYPDPEGNSSHNPVRMKFWESWGGSEYWDEVPDTELVEKNHKISMKNLMINLMNDDDQSGHASGGGTK